MRQPTIAACLLATASLFGCLTVPRVERRGTDLVPREPCSGRPEALVQASPDGQALAARLAEELAQAGILVHLAPPPSSAWMARTYVVAMGDLANSETVGAAGRVAIAPSAPTFGANVMQPLLLIREPGPAHIAQSSRPVWELRFEGLRDGFHLSVEEEHTLIEAVVLWIRNRAVD